jgi:two-component system, cell cycle sensor histidine kinase and response regulator CckA
MTEKKIDGNKDSKVGDVHQYCDVIMKNSAAIIYVKDIDGRYLFVNPRWEDATGITKEAALGNKAVDVFPEHVGEQFQNNEAEAIKTGEPFNFEEIFQSGNSVRYFHTTIIPFRDESGTTVGVCGMSSEITEQKAAKSLLEKRLSYEKLLSDISVMAVSVYDIDDFLDRTLTEMGEAFNVSRAYIFEHDKENDVMDNTFEWCAPGVFPHIEELQGLPAADFKWWSDTLMKGDVICFKNIEDIPDETAKEILRPQGILSLLVVPLFVNGEYYGFIGFDDCRENRKWFKEDIELLLAMSRILVNVIERKMVEDELRESEEKFRQLAESTSAAIFIHDGKKIQFVNNAATRYTGFTSDELKEMSPEQLIYPEDKESVMGLWSKRKQGENVPDTYECRLNKKDGSFFWVEITANLMKRSKGNYLIGTAFNITDRKKAEEQLQVSESRFQRMLALVPDMISIHDRDMNIVYSNWKGFGCVPDERRKLGTKCYKTYRGYDDLCPDCQAKTVIETREAFNSEIMLPDGRWVDLRIIPFLDEKGGVELFVEWVRDITENKKAEQNLRESEERFMKLSSFTFEGIIIHDKGIAIDMNQSAAEMIGYGRDEIIGRSLFDVIHPDYHAITKENLVKKVAAPYRIVAIRKDGSTFDAEIEAKDIYYNGEYFRVACVRDITENKKAEQELRESEERYKALHNASFGGIVIHDKGLILECNQGLSDITGYSCDELIGMNGLLLIAEYARDKVIKNINEGYELPYESVGVRKNGEEYPLRLHASNIPFKGKIVRSTEFRDITEQKKSQAELQKIEWMLSRKPSDKFTSSEYEDQGYGDITALNRGGLISSFIDKDTLRNIASEYLDLLETSSAIYEKNGDYAYGIFCSGWCRMMDSASRKLCNTNDNEVALNSGKWLCHESCWTNCSKKAIESGKPIDIECSGGIHLYAVPIFSKNEVIGAINFGYGDPPKDVEKLRSIADTYNLDPEKLIHEADMFDSRPTYIIELAKQRLLSSARLIGIMVEQKQAEEEQTNLQKQLAQSQKMESIGRLAGGIAHDFNNMLSVISGRVELALMKADESSSLHSDLEEIREAAERSASLTAQLLAFARKQVISPKIININEIIGNMNTFLKRLIGENIELNWNPGKDISNIMIDPVQIDQVLANLCVNSKDAISEHGTITIKTENCIVKEVDSNFPGLIPGEYVKIVVEDDGQGMDQEIASQIFEPFFTTKEQGKGTGLGLATVFGIVKQNKGYIYCNSTPGAGTRFDIYLPQKNQMVTEIVKEEKHYEKVSRDYTILLVEDEPSILEMAKDMLESFGYKVISASSPQQALKESLERGSIDLLLTDVVMPEMNGKELSKKIISQHPQMKTLFMSGYTAEVIAHENILDEDMNFLRKPFSMNQLREKVKKIMGEK